MGRATQDKPDVMPAPRHVADAKNKMGFDDFIVAGSRLPSDRSPCVR